jgi:hypothetical protein
MDRRGIIPLIWPRCPKYHQADTPLPAVFVGVNLSTGL